MSDAQAFTNSYKQALAEEISNGMWPKELTQVYEVESCLKHSGAKEVYLVTDKRTGGRVVLRATDLDANERADVEHAILQRLNFPGIPKTYGTFIKDGRSYLAREYFEGEPLDQVVARGVMQPAQIYHIARQLCALLGYLHAQTPPVIHRDIKPQNIILRPDGSLGLTDFGIARTYKEGSSSDTNYMGTLPYAPPEQYGYAQSSPQTDIYALGIVLIYLATGSPDRRDLEKRITDSQLRTLIEKCIAFDPKHRFQSVEQVIKRIDFLKTRRLRIALRIIVGCIALGLIGIGIWQLAGLLGASEPPPSEGEPTTSSVQNAATELVEASSIIQWNADDYPSTSDPRIGSSNWLYDYNQSGNLHGNINNGGFAVSTDSSDVFYVTDGENIYKVDAEGTVLEEIYTSASFSEGPSGSLNSYSNTLYFPDNTGALHKLSTKDADSESVMSAVVVERIYFDDGRMYGTNMVASLHLYWIKTDGSSATLVSMATEAYYTNIVDGIRYYADGADGYRIYAQELSTGKTALVYDSPAHWLSVCNGRIYFEDEGSGCLASIRLDGSDYQLVYDEPCYNIVATSQGIFAVSAIDKELVVVDIKGDHQVLLETADLDFCVVNGWVIYREDGVDTALRMVRHDGTDDQEIKLR